jgi:hypothetical protein
MLYDVFSLFATDLGNPKLRCTAFRYRFANISAIFMPYSVEKLLV